MESIWIATAAYVGDGVVLLAFMECTLQRSASVVHAELEVLYESRWSPVQDVDS